MSTENEEREKYLLYFKNKMAAEEEIRERQDDEWVHRAAIFGIDYDSKFVAYAVPMTTRTKEEKIRDEFLIATREGFKLIQVDKEQGGLSKEFVKELVTRQIANNIFHFDKETKSGYFRGGLLMNNSLIIAPDGTYEYENFFSENFSIKRQISNCRLIDVSVTIPSEEIKIIKIRDANWRHIDRMSYGQNPKERMYGEYQIY
jgi:hypothetical protein